MAADDTTVGIGPDRRVSLCLRCERRSLRSIAPCGSNSRPPLWLPAAWRPAARLNRILLRRYRRIEGRLIKLLELRHWHAIHFLATERAHELLPFVQR